MTYCIEQINGLSSEAFIELFGDVYEHSAWVARAVDGLRPFADCEALEVSMRSVVENASDQQKLQLLQAHPEFAGKAATAGELTDSSTAEQGRLSLNALPEAQHRQMQEYNQRFMDKFGFPGIVAVRLNNSVDDIFSQFEQRLGNDRQTEISVALTQVYAIVHFRLADLVG